jgi:hypothetical protein
VVIDFIAISTMPDTLMDTLTVTFLVEDCAYQFAWMEPPPRWDDPCRNPPIEPDVPHEVYACGDYEFPVGLHFDYPYVLDEPIYSIYLELDYDIVMGVPFEVGNEGLITEHLGTLTYRIDPDYSETEGKIYVSMAFNYPLQWPPWPMPPDPLNPPFGFVQSWWYKLFYVGFHIPDELPTSTLLMLTLQQCKCKVNELDYKCCNYADLVWLHVRDFAIAGEVYYSDSFLPVPGVTMKTVDVCGGTVSSVDITDQFGHYESKPWPGCSAFCIEPWAEADRDVWHQIVTSLDATLILRALCGGYIMSHNDSLAADVTGDGTVSAFDASVIMKWVVCNYCGTELIPSEVIGTWIFEYYGDIVAQWGADCACYPDVRQDYLDEDWEAVIIGDVTQNWPGGSPKVVADGIDAEVGAKSVTLRFDEASAVDMTLSSDLKVVDVSAGAELLEWAVDGQEVRIAAASAGELGPVTVTFERLLPTTLEISATVDEGVVLTSAVKMAPMPTEFALAQNYPNPFNPTTTIEYALPHTAKVKVEVYNTLGQVVAELVDTEQAAGYHSVSWDASDAASGVYFYRIVADNFTATKRMILMK